jgi:hypothetical protein
MTKSKMSIITHFASLGLLNQRKLHDGTGNMQGGYYKCIYDFSSNILKDKVLGRPMRNGIISAFFLNLCLSFLLVSLLFH